MQDNTTSVSGLESPKKEFSAIPLLIWIAIGVVVGLAVYMLLPSPSPIIPSGNNSTIIPPVNNTIVPKIVGLEITFINYPDCKECNSTATLLGQFGSIVSKFNMTVTSVKTLNTSSSDAQVLISKYSIVKTPTFVVVGNDTIPSGFTSVWSQVGSVESDKALVLREVYPPYYDITKGKVVGIVGMTTILPSNCPECFNVSEFGAYLRSNVAIVFSNTTALSENSSEASALIAKYNVSKLPTFFLTEDVSAYPYIQQMWKQFGSVESDGVHVYRSTIPPYFDLTTNKTRGIVEYVELVDQNCTACYNVSIHYDTLKKSVGMYFSNRSTVDISSAEGKALISKYNISEVPTMLLSGDAMLYPGFNSSWAEMGSVESDGWLVFRSVDKLGVTYRDLITGNVTTGTAPTQ